MGFQKAFPFIFAFLVLFFMSSSQGYKFYVGGKTGWVVNPSESYNHWAERMRFQVNDTLFFKFNKGNDSVLVVTRENYNHCKTKNPIKSLTEGDSEFKVERSGPHYFISGNSTHCKKGQQLIVVVLSVRHKKTPTLAPAPATSASTPAPASRSPASGPASSPWATVSPAQPAEKSFAPVFGSPVVGLVISVSVGVGVILGSCVGWA